MMNNKLRIEREIGKIQLRKSSIDNQLISDLQEFFNLHQKRWAPTDTPSLFMDSRYCNFYYDAGLQLLPKRQIGLAVLEAGDVTLGHLLFFIFKRSVLIQLLTYDPDYYKYSPMVVLIEMFVDEASASDIKEIDFGSYYPYKETWADQLKNRFNLLIFPNRFLPSAIYGITKLYLGLRLRIRQYPFVLNIVKRILKRMGIRK
jgi:CelD/BcsL family acetyltransferase involved in cellulose biosynthesis